MGKRGIIILSSIVGFVLLCFAGLFYYQSTRFNSNISVDHVKVGGNTAHQALKKLKSAESKNVVYIGKKQILDGKDTKMGFTDQDLADLKKILRKQKTFFPSSQSSNYSLIPQTELPYKNQTMKKKLSEKLATLNKSLKAPKDAQALVKQGKMVISKSEKGNQYDVNELLKAYGQKEYQSEIHLNPAYKKPITVNSPLFVKVKNKLQNLLKRTVQYKVQGKPYDFQGKDIIQKASVSKNKKFQYMINMNAIKKKLEDINHTQSTLNKNYTFKSHSGKVISVKGQSYGWRLHVDDEAKRIKIAFEQGKPSILAYNVYGVGWNVNGVGYHTTTNHGMGNSYVEVSIEDQRMWVYEDGKLKVTTHVVTGTHAYNEDTPKGVWYIMYKQSPSVLKGSEVGNPNYKVKVKYWAPFTLTGDGLHDASWRSNWASDAYIRHGSGGCVNTPPSVMKSVYENVKQYEPVVIH